MIVSIRTAAVLTAAGLAASLGLTGCDNASAVETRDRTAAEGPSTLAAAPAADQAVEAKPVLTTSRRETVDVKIQRLYERNGADFAARSPEDYLAKVGAFTTRPPADAETIKRPNGDTLIYQAATNTFAVVARDGTPRTMFKPTTGAEYWAEQKAAAPTFGQRRQSTADAG